MNSGGQPKRVVYLDTQDYSRIADAVAGRGDDRLLPIYDRLRAFAREGTFSFCFSYMIMSELLRLNPQDIEIARRKAAVVEELCGSQGFPNIFWLLSAELDIAARARGLDQHRRRVSVDDVVFGGQWIRTELPDAQKMFAGFDVDASASTVDALRRRLRREPNRKEKRLASRLLPLNAAIGVVAESPIYPIIEGTGLVAKFADALRRRQLPSVSEDFFRLVARPTRLVLSHHHLHSMGFLNDQLTVLKDSLYARFTQFRNECDDLRRDVPTFGRDQRQEMLMELLGGQMVSMTRTLRPHLVRYGAPDALFDVADFDRLVAALGFQSVWRDLWMSYLMMVTDDAAQRRALQPSDIVDFMHAMYMPYCAVWRSDRYFANLATPVARGLGCRVVATLAELPDVLEGLASA